jgi:hypothetical protein
MRKGKGNFSHRDTENTEKTTIRGFLGVLGASVANLGSE